MIPSEVSDVLFMDYSIAPRPGVHCAPQMYEALGTVTQGAVHFRYILMRASYALSRISSTICLLIISLFNRTFFSDIVCPILLEWHIKTLLYQDVKDHVFSYVSLFTQFVLP